MKYKIIFAGAVVAVISCLLLYKKFGKKRKDFIKKLLISSLIVLAVVFYGILNYFFTEYAVRFAGIENVTLKAEVRAVTEYVFTNETEIKITEINGKPAPLSLYALFSDYNKTTSKNDIILFRADIKSLLETEDISMYDYYRSKNIYLRCEQIAGEDAEENYDEQVIPLTVAGSVKENFTVIFSDFREYARKLFFSQITSRDTPENWTNTYKDTDAGALIYSMFTGDKSYISTAIKSNFAATGISHLITVSGLTLSIFTSTLLFFMQKMRINKKASYIILILFCIMYMGFTGFAIGVVRAGIMQILYYSAFLLGGSGDSITSLFFAGALICLVSLLSVFNFGFRLSFFATLGIILTVPLSDKILKRLHSKNIFSKTVKFLLSSLFTTVAAITFTIPFTSYATSVVSLSALIVNILVSVPANLILFILPLYILLSFVPFFSVALVGMVLSYLSEFILKISDFFAGFKYTQTSVSTCMINVFVIAAAFSLILIIFYFIAAPFITKRKKILPVLIAASFVLQILTAVLPKIYMYGYLQISFYTVNTNQYIMIFSEDPQKADLIDIGGGHSSVAGDLAGLVKKHGAVGINKLIFTHYHANQPKEIEKLLNYMNITSVYFPFPEDDYETGILDEIIYQNGKINRRGNFEIITYDRKMVLSEKYSLSLTSQNYKYQQEYVLTGAINFGGRNYVYMNSGIYDESIENFKADGDRDIVFIGNHQHKLKNFQLETDVKGNYASVIASHTYSPPFNEDSIFLDNKNYITFLISKNNKDDIKYIQRFIYE